MYSFVKTFHSHFAWLVLIGILAAVIVAAMAVFGKKSWDKSQFKIALIGLILAHTQLLLGLILYFVSPLGIKNMSGATMKDSFARLLAVEHPLINIIALVLITLGYVQAKKLLGTTKAPKKVMIMYGIGLLLILSRLPYNVWLG